MLRLNTIAPDFTLTDQHGAPFRLSEHRGRHQVLLSFIPAAFTPICGTEVPALDALSPRFNREANTVVAVVTPDNAPVNAAWARELGVRNVQLLSDWNPHGLVSQAYDAWNGADGICDRASVLIGADGRVKYAESVGKFGKRAAPALLDIAIRAAGGRPAPAGQTARMTMDLPVVYTMRGCSHCEAVKAFLDRSALMHRVVVRDVATDSGAMEELLKLDGSGSVPLLAQNGRSVALGDADVIATLRRLYGV